MKKKKSTLAELRNGQPTLNNGHPAEWLVNAVGQTAADAAMLFDAPAIEMLPDGAVIRLQEATR
jgi:hypothetical protein